MALNLTCDDDLTNGDMLTHAKNRLDEMWRILPDFDPPTLQMACSYIDEMSEAVYSLRISDLLDDSYDYELCGSGG